MKLLNKILIANRGEIAVRIIRTLKTLGIRTVAIYSHQDKDSLHVRMADEAFSLGGNILKDTYLDIAKIIHIALQSGCDGIHPGYGFLSENAKFSKAAADAGINFIGPDAETIRLMGDKVMARQTMREINIPMITGMEGSKEEILRHKKNLQYPLLVKAASGGGGKAMRIVENLEDLSENLDIASREALNYFGNDLLYVEKYLPDARHIEVQILADHYGNILILGERECSVQRRYQKVIEESPACSLSAETRDSLYRSANKIVKKIQYTNAGTLEFLVDPEGNHYFLEMNTRIQVEHAVTEMVTGLDIVELQTQVAAGNKLVLKQSDIQISGYAIEARLYAEDPTNDFMPSPGKIELYHQPSSPGLRIDSGIDGPLELYSEYDPLIAKLIYYSHSRQESIDGLKNALRDFTLLGIKTNREFLIEVLEDKAYVRNMISTSYLEKISSKLNDNLLRKKSEFNRMRILSAWLGWKLTNFDQQIGTSVWERIGPWRMTLRKSVIFSERQYDIFIHNYSAENINFQIDGVEHNLIIKSRNSGNIIFELDGKWSNASLSGSSAFEDSICLEGLEFKLRPLDSLPLQPWLTDHNDDGQSGERLVKSQLHGKISAMKAKVGLLVKKGDILFSLDAMKIENKVTSAYDGVIKEVKVKEGDQVQINQLILILEEGKISNIT